MGVPPEATLAAKPCMACVKSLTLGVFRSAVIVIVGCMRPLVLPRAASPLDRAKRLGRGGGGAAAAGDGGIFAVGRAEADMLMRCVGC